MHDPPSGDDPLTGASGDGPERAELARLAASLWRRSDRAGRIGVQGRSMKPTLWEGGQVFFRPLGDRRPGRGDILLYAERSGLVVHRVVGPVPGGWRTKGDGRATFDSRPVTLDAVVGRVYAVERRAGRFSLDGTRARAYAQGLALCSVVCGRSARIADLGDRMLRRLLRSSGRPRPLGRVLALAWQTFVVVLDFALFRPVHRRLPDVGARAEPPPGE